MTETLPEPKSRKESYLAKAAGVAGVELPEKPESREELYLNAIAEGGGTTYTAGDGIDITSDIISATNTGKPKVLTADDYDYPDNNPTQVALWRLEGGAYKVTSSNVLVAFDTSTVNVSFANGTNFYILRHPASNSEYDRTAILFQDGLTPTCFTIYTNTGIRISKKEIGGPDIATSTGNSTSKVMTQNATTSMVFSDPSTRQKVRIGAEATNSQNNGTAVGYASGVYSAGGTAIGRGAVVDENSNGGIALGSYSHSTHQGEMNIGSTATNNGYNSSNYRLLTGLYDGQTAHDAATKGQLDGVVLTNAGTPTTATVGTVGQLLEDTTNGKLYICTAVTPGTDPDPDTYTWEEVGAGGSITPVQTTGTSTTDVMSQNAVTSMVFADPSTKEKVQIGASAQASVTSATAIGSGSSCTGPYGTALGYSAGCRGQESVSCGSGALVTSGSKSAVSIGAGSKVQAQYAVSLGSFSNATQKGQMDISTTKTNNTYGYNDSQYRLLTGLYDGQSNHDAATVAQGNKLMTVAPTTTDAGVLGQLWTDTTNMHTYQLTAIDTTDPDNPSYSWTMRW